MDSVITMSEAGTTAEVKGNDAGSGGETTPALFITKLEENDVLVGRGAPSIANRGNIKFRQLVQTRKGDYMSTSKRAKKDAIAREIVQTVQQERNGRFLRRITSAEERRQYQVPPGTSAAWVMADDDIILEKVKQALRERESGNPSAEYVPDNSDAPSVSSNSEEDKEEERDESRRARKNIVEVKNEEGNPFLFENALAAGRGNMGPNPFVSNNYWNGVRMMVTAPSVQQQQQQAQQNMRNQMFSTAFFPRPQDMPRHPFWGVHGPPQHLGNLVDLPGGFPNFATMAPKNTDIYPESHQSRQKISSPSAVGRTPSNIPTNEKLGSVSNSSTTTKILKKSPPLEPQVPRKNSDDKEAQANSISFPTSAAETDETAAEHILRTAREVFLEGGSPKHLLSSTSKGGEKEDMGEHAENESVKEKKEEALEGSLEITLIELLMLIVLSSHGLPPVQDGASARIASHRSKSPVDVGTRPQDLYTWNDMAVLLQSAAMDYFERQRQSVLDKKKKAENDASVSVTSLLRVEYRAVEVATCYSRNLPEFAAAVVMLLQKVTECAAAAQNANAGPPRSEEATSNNESTDAGSCKATGNPATGSDGTKNQGEHAFQGCIVQHQFAELAVSVGAFDYEKWRPMARSAADFVLEHPEHRADEALSIAALLSPDSCKVVCTQIFHISSLRTIHWKSINSEKSFSEKLKRVLSRDQASLSSWKGRPSWWGAQGDSFHQDLFLIERLFRSGFVGILGESGICLAANYPAPLSLQQLGLTKSAVESRIMQLSKALQSDEESTRKDALAATMNKCFEVMLPTKALRNKSIPSPTSGSKSAGTSEFCSKRGRISEVSASVRCRDSSAMHQPDPPKRSRFF